MSAAVVVARGPRPELVQALGSDGARRLAETLRARAAAWAQEVAPGQTVTVGSSAELAAATAEAYDRWGGPLLIAGTEAPRLGAVQTAAALADLGDGADATFGPGMNGGWYLAALARPVPEVFSPEGWEGDQPMAQAMALAQRLRLEVGVLRMERLLISRRDALALAVDPLTPADVRAVLAPLRS